MTVEEIKELIAKEKEAGNLKTIAYENEKKQAIKEGIEFFKVLDYIKEQGFDIPESYVIGSDFVKSIELKVLLDSDRNIIGLGFTYDDMAKYDLLSNTDTSYIAYLDREGNIHIKPNRSCYNPHINFESMFLSGFSHLKKRVEEQLRSNIKAKYNRIQG